MAKNIKKSIFDKRGREPKLYRLDNGRTSVTVKQVMSITGLKLSAVRNRLAHFKDSKRVLAPKGTHTDIYGKNKIKAKEVINKPIHPSGEVSEKKRLTTHILNTHPFYDKGEKGTLHRLAFGNWVKDN